jgi:hypothetical protein
VGPVVSGAPEPAVQEDHQRPARPIRGKFFGLS